MLIVMKSGASASEIEKVLEVIDALGYRAHSLPGANRTAIGVTGNPGAIDPSHFENLAGVAQAIRVTQPYKLISKDLRPEKSVIKVGTATIGGSELAMIAGPCALENHEQVFSTAKIVAESGAKFFRGGAYKPRTSPYAFQGLGVDGLKMMTEVREQYGLNIVTEAMDEQGVDAVEKYGDCIQIGARNMQNFSLLKYVGQTRKPVLLKRGLSATLEEFLLAAEYIMAEGNYEVILCERGIRTFATHARNTLDLSVVPAVHRISHLPIIVDPSHGTGRNYMVEPLARASVAVGADGLIIEVHPCPEDALCDGAQALTPGQYLHLVEQVRRIYEVTADNSVAQTSS
ncbi:MAG TPA: 3-deoxy-7-phosphoheptulonate synthase [Pyrinomonadaceae bacterium]|nr:3-deoxy-7-phosphoheptulonate synthase [Chloracidobacterium sp.]MBL0239426.1 3-deoxy-7-phosphoheptulonate synthase [Chloracidobacterium sp.]MBP9936674.1 3-deoxy-7-phosphoheptulonate synthase [Pyrinomonadaceae bacterium]HQX56441.1 3-deoxy-7-phosphoheptulonate synthase [Pyrinomonadaceae bacterium]HQY68014.1 3-deoxy-7-phosphoheptulonate synthase [Pyrinomonadaceae bacterium]